jgi:hypothetical protein
MVDGGVYAFLHVALGCGRIESRSVRQVQM